MKGIVSITRAIEKARKEVTPSCYVVAGGHYHHYTRASDTSVRYDLRNRRALYAAALATGKEVAPCRVTLSQPGSLRDIVALLVKEA